MTYAPCRTIRTNLTLTARDRFDLAVLLLRRVRYDNAIVTDVHGMPTHFSH